MHQAFAALMVGILGAAEAQPPSPYHELLAIAARHQESTVRKGALRALETLHWKPTTDRHWNLLAACGPDALRFLKSFLQSKESDTRSQCLRTIAEIGKNKPAREEALQLLTDRGVQEREPSVLKVCAEALVGLGWPANDEECAMVFARKPLPWAFVDALIGLPRGRYVSSMLSALEPLRKNPQFAPEARKRFDAIATGMPEEMARWLLGKDWRPASDDDWRMVISLGAYALPLFDRYLADKDLRFTVRAIEETLNLVKREPKARAGVFARLCSCAFDGNARVEVREAASAAIVALEGPANQQEMNLIVSHGKAAMPLVRRLFESGDQKARTSALECVAHLAKADVTLRNTAVDLLLSAWANPKIAQNALTHLAGLDWPKSATDFADTAKRNQKAWDALEPLATTAKPNEAKSLCGILETVARGKDDGAKKATSLLANLATTPKATSARPHALAALKRLAADPKFPARAGILKALVGVGDKDKTLRGDVAGFLASQLDPKLEGPTRDAVLDGLVALGWTPTSEAEVKKLIAIGPAALRLTEGLVQHPEPAIRKKALRVVSRTAEQHEKSRDVAFRQLAKLAQVPELSQEAVRVLRLLGWPRGDEDWADLAELGAPAMPILRTLIADTSPAVRGRAAAALAQVAAEDASLRPGAVSILLRLVLLDSSAPVREAAMASLAARLQWPASEADWGLLGKLHCKALVPLAWLTRRGPEAARQKARARARELYPALLAQAELRVDEASLLEGIELRWDLLSEDAEKKILELAARNKAELVEVEFRRILDLAEKSEERVHALAINLSRWPLAGVADKWKALSHLLENKALEPFRGARKLTVATWRAMLRKRSADLALWHEAFKKVAAATASRAKLGSLSKFITGNPQSYYARFAWKWKDILSR